MGHGQGGFFVVKTLFLIFACQAAGDLLVRLLGWDFPSSVVGLFVLFALLQSGLARLRDVEGVSNVIMGNLTLFFIPPTVGVMAYYRDVLPYAWIIVAAIALSTVLVMLASGLTHQVVRRLS